MFCPRLRAVQSTKGEIWVVHQSQEVGLRAWLTPGRVGANLFHLRPL